MTEIAGEFITDNYDEFNKKRTIKHALKYQWSQPNTVVFAFQMRRVIMSDFDAVLLEFESWRKRYRPTHYMILLIDGEPLRISYDHQCSDTLDNTHLFQYDLGKL